jgi:hypothetical protein
VKSLIDLPTALVSPELIKVETMPTKKVYDFTKRSENYRYIEDTNLSLENLEYEERRCDSRLKEEDLKLLEIELKKK